MEVQLEQFMRKSKGFADNTPGQGGDYITQEMRSDVP